MTYKILCGLLIITFTTLIGWKFTEKLKFREIVYDSLVKFCNSIIADVYFTSQTVDRFIDEMSECLKDITSLTGKDFRLGVNVSLTDKRFTQEESLDIENFFNFLGKNERDGTLKMLNYYKERFSEKHDECKVKYKKSSAFYLKISALLGALIFVTLL